MPLLIMLTFPLNYCIYSCVHCTVSCLGCVYVTVPAPLVVFTVQCLLPGCIKYSEAASGTFNVECLFQPVCVVQRLPQPVFTGSAVECDYTGKGRL
jgi:hypothetical protein